MKEQLFHSTPDKRITVLTLRYAQKQTVDAFDQGQLDNYWATLTEYDGLADALDLK